MNDVRDRGATATDAQAPVEVLDVQGVDGHRWQVLAVVPAHPTSQLLWLPAMGVAARHYLPLAHALAARGQAVFIHDWRGNGSSSLRPSRAVDWGYRELLELDLPATCAAMRDRLQGLPRVVGGHSLGGQLGACFLGQHPDLADQLWLVASGAPYWRAFPSRHRWWLPLVYRFLPWLGQRLGYLPGRRIGFGGNESRSLIRDWARTALSGVYRADGVVSDLEAGMATLDIQAQAVVLENDWLAPRSSARFLLSKLTRVRSHTTLLGREQLETSADHFSWMKHPDAVVRVLLSGR